MPYLKGIGSDPSVMRNVAQSLFNHWRLRFFFATSMAISHVPLTFFLFKEIDHLDLSILALRKIHNQVVVYLHKDVNSSYVQLESLNVSNCVCGFRSLSV